MRTPGPVRTSPPVAPSAPPLIGGWQVVDEFPTRPVETVSPVPLPASAGMLLAGLVGLIGRRFAR